MAINSSREQILKEAWIGDAALCLFAREKILREDGLVEGWQLSGGLNAT
ncbi:MAG: hypothetical protein WBW33_02845 [Bryobacteraceae bacterium]